MEKLVWLCGLLTLLISQIVQPCISNADPSDTPDKVIIGIDEWPPYHSCDLKHFGFGTHIMTEAFAVVGIRTKIVFRPWKRALVESERGYPIDATFWGGYTDWIDTHYGSDPVFKGEYVLFIRKGLTLNFQAPESFKGLTMGNLIGEGVPDQLQEIVTKGYLRIESVENSISNFKKLVAKRIDMIALNRDVGLSIMRQALSETEREQITTHPEHFRLSLYRLVFSKSAKKKSLYLLEKFNDGLEILHTSGRIREILDAQKDGEYKQ